MYLEKPATSSDRMEICTNNTQVLHLQMTGLS